MSHKGKKCKEANYKRELRDTNVSRTREVSPARRKEFRKVTESIFSGHYSRRSDEITITTRAALLLRESSDVMRDFVFNSCQNPTLSEGVIGTDRRQCTNSA